MIHIGRQIEFDDEEVFEQLNELKEEAYDEADAEAIRTWVKKLVPTYRLKTEEKHPIVDSAVHIND